ncbi:jg27842, partial [Pararge aegeria aegeria]
MVDPVIMYQNYGNPIQAQIVNLEDKQIVFPEDDDSDIIIVNEDFNRNTIEEDRMESLKEGIGDLVDLTTESTDNWIPPSDVNDYVWMTTEWSTCSGQCGQSGHQIRGAVCQHKISNQTKIVETDDCTSRGLTAPTVLRDCASNSCATWRTSAWSLPRCSPSGIGAVAFFSPFVQRFGGVKGLEDVFNFLDWNGLGININGEYITQLRFADDVVIMAETLEDLNAMLNDLSRVSQQ